MSAIINTFEANKRLADRAVEQVPDEKLHTALDANANGGISLSRLNCNFFNRLAERGSVAGVTLIGHAGRQKLASAVTDPRLESLRYRTSV